MLGITHGRLVGWVAAAAPGALSLRTLPQDHAFLVVPNIPHTFSPETTSRRGSVSTGGNPLKDRANCTPSPWSSQSAQHPQHPQQPRYLPHLPFTPRTHADACPGSVTAVTPAPSPPEPNPAGGSPALSVRRTPPPWGSSAAPESRSRIRRHVRGRGGPRSSARSGMFASNKELGGFSVPSEPLPSTLGTTPSTLGTTP